MNRIRDLRKEVNMNQLDLAKKFNLSQQTISSYENNTREPDTETLKRMAEFFGVSVDYLLGYSDIRSPHNEIVTEPGTCYNLDVKGLPDEAVKQVEAYIEFMKHRYGREERR